MNDDTILRALRMMAWQRATGELRALLHTYKNDQERYFAMVEAIDEFEGLVIENGLHE